MSTNNIQLDSKLMNLTVASHELNKTLTNLNYLKYDIGQAWVGDEVKYIQGALEGVKEEIIALTTYIDELKRDIEQIGAVPKENG
ncbi:MAG: hypothetical protein ACRC7N_16710 [Clostridium sp.]